MHCATTIAPFATAGSPAWYCVQVRSSREQIAAENLRQRTGVTVFCPQIRLATASVARSVSEALFPGYVFARFLYPDQARHVASTPGVLGLVTFGGPPPAIADDVIDHLSLEVGRAAPVQPFTAGAWVRIVTGCFRGSEGCVIQSALAGDRVGILLHLLGQAIQISLPRDQLIDTAGLPGRLPAGLRAGPEASVAP